MAQTSTPDASVATVRLTPASSNGEGAQEDSHDYYDFQKAKGVFDKLIDGWKSQDEEVTRQRAVRYIKDSDSLSLRQRGILLADEMYSPQRLIDQNIRSEKPALIKYLTQSTRSVIFETTDLTPVDGKEKLEAFFTNCARFLKWEIPWTRCFDGSQAHGKDSVEVVFDASKPGNFRIDHIGPSRLIFSTDSEDLHAQEVIAIERILTSNQLRTMKGFNKEQVSKIVQTNAAKIGSQDCSHKCYKVYFKQDGIVHVAWYAKDGCDSYLMEPKPLWLGKRDFTAAKINEDPENPEAIADYPSIYETEAPVYILPYSIDNDPRIIEIVGRCKLDEPAQEAASALQTAMVNGANRASKVMGAPKQNNLGIPPNAEPTMTNKVIGAGRLWDQPIDFFTTPWPAQSIVGFINQVVTSNKQEQGSGIAFAALNRKDTEKTATELNMAQQESQELGSVQIILLSVFIREVYACCWGITQNRVLQGKIKVKDPSLLMLFGDNVDATEDGVVLSCTGAKEYILKSSGDIDVIQRQQHLQKLMQGWEVFGKTAISVEYLKDIIRYSFPEDASKYINIIDTGIANQADALKNLLIKVSKVLQAIVQDPSSIATVSPEALQQLAMEVMSAVAAPSIPGSTPSNPIEEMRAQAMQLQEGQPANN